MTIYQANTSAFAAAIAAMKQQRAATELSVEAAVRDILTDVKQSGWDAVVKYSEQFDNAAPYEIEQTALKAAYDGLSATLRNALERAKEQLFDYQSKLVAPLLEEREWRSPVGGTVGQLVRPMQRVGVYVPGGTAAYPSSVLANVVPAKAAGVGEIIMVTPPSQYLKQSVLAAAYIAGVDRVFAVGGVQAVGALAYGALPLGNRNKSGQACEVAKNISGIASGGSPVDIIVGPGNAYVAEAKKQVFGQVGIDSIAGPSDILVIADSTANPAYVAADLLGQAEHDELAQAILVSDSRELLEAVRTELDAQLAALPRRDIATKSLQDFGLFVHCDDLTACCALSNEFAPEHLEIITENPRELLPMIQSAGAVFVGAYTPEAVGDYMAGPSHVLPTEGSARFFSPLSAETFLRKMSLLEFDKTSLAALAEDVVVLAEEEELIAHGRSVSVRM